jgi:peptidoglycan-N-acetylglucosamine deacetylase
MSAGMLIKRAVARVAPRQVIYRGPSAHARVALTFDDGPHPENTPRILEALARSGAQATFFLQGHEAGRQPHLVRAIHAAGHQVGNHAATHRSPAELGTRSYVQEVLDTQALLSDIVGAPVGRSFRPPYGATSMPTFLKLCAAGFRYVFWSRDSRDSWVREPGALVDHFARQQATAGDIVLFHDDYAHTAAALPALLQGMQAQGLAAVTVEQLQ